MVHRVVTGKYTPDARPTQTVNRSARAAGGTRTHLRRLSKLIVAEELVAHSLELRGVLHEKRGVGGGHPISTPVPAHLSEQ